MVSGLPRAVADGVEAALAAQLARPVTIARTTPVSGGCISRTARVVTTAGDTAFLKWRASDEAIPGLFEAEVDGLRAIAATRTVRVPEVLGWSDAAAGEAAWILLEWLEPAWLDGHGWERLGSDLAGMHRARDREFGWPRPNFIGPLPQRNDPTEDWPELWITRRLEPQLRVAADAGALSDGDVRRVERLFDRLPDILAPAMEDGASLLHGDLWSGNVHPVTGDAAALIDPACYNGHREVDLAMATLFGGFPSGFFAAYREAWPLLPDHEERRPVYQLYYLLVHVNLFGGSYLQRTREALAAAERGR